MTIQQLIPGPLSPVEEDYYCLMHYRYAYCCMECGGIKESDERSFCRRCDWEIESQEPPFLGGKPIDEP